MTQQTQQPPEASEGEREAKNPPGEAASSQTPKAPSSPQKAKPQVRSLRAEKSCAKSYLKEVRSELKEHGGRLSSEARKSIDDAVAALDAALSGKSAEAIAEAREKLEHLAEEHLKFRRSSETAEYILAIAEALAIALVLRFFIVEPYKIPSGSMIPTLLIGDHIFVNKLSYGVRIPALDKLAVHWGGYKRGDVVVFVNPLDDDLPLLQRRDYVKRIVGLPGDTIEVKNEVIHINGIPQARQSIDSSFGYYDRLPDGTTWLGQKAELLHETLIRTGNGSEEGAETIVHDVLRDPMRPHPVFEGPFQVPDGHLFMMGDNRDNSQDGRYGRDGGWFVPFGHVKGRAFVIWYSWGVPGSWPWGDKGIRFGRLFRGI